MGRVSRTKSPLIPAIISVSSSTGTAAFPRASAPSPVSAMIGRALDSALTSSGCTSSFSWARLSSRFASISLTFLRSVLCQRAKARVLGRVGLLRVRLRVWWRVATGRTRERSWERRRRGAVAVVVEDLARERRRPRDARRDMVWWWGAGSVHCWTVVGEERRVEWRVNNMAGLVGSCFDVVPALELAGKLHAGQCQRGCSRTQLMGGINQYPLQ